MRLLLIFLVVARIDQNPVDILHLGITVIPENGGPTDAKSFESYDNQQSELQGSSILRDEG